MGRVRHTETAILSGSNQPKYWDSIAPIPPPVETPLNYRARQ